MEFHVTFITFLIICYYKYSSLTHSVDLLLHLTCMFILITFPVLPQERHCIARVWSYSRHLLGTMGHSLVKSHCFILN